MTEIDAINHTNMCITLTTNHRRLKAAFAIYWGDHCKTCNGLGGRVFYYDPSPAGVGLSAGWMQDFDPCLDCIEQGLCPRCGKAHDFTEGNPLVCPHCEWDSEQAYNHHNFISLLPDNMTDQCIAAYRFHAIPDEPECSCYEELAKPVYEDFADLYEKE